MSDFDQLLERFEQENAEECKKRQLEQTAAAEKHKALEELKQAAYSDIRKINSKSAMLTKTQKGECWRVFCEKHRTALKYLGKENEELRELVFNFEFNFNQKIVEAVEKGRAEIAKKTRHPARLCWAHNYDDLHRASFLFTGPDIDYLRKFLMRATGTTGCENRYIPDGYGGENGPYCRYY